jgi:hypothetical protein
MKEKMMVEKKIKNSVISKTPWGEVDKTKLGQKLAELGNKSYIKETYLVVGDYEKRSTWKFPHHELLGGDLVVNKNGVIAAYQALRGARHDPNISPTQKKEAAKHLLRHYRTMKQQKEIEEIPEELYDMTKQFMIEEMIEKIDKMLSVLDKNNSKV